MNLLRPCGFLLLLAAPAAISAQDSPYRFDDSDNDIGIRHQPNFYPSAPFQGPRMHSIPDLSGNEFDDLPPHQNMHQDWRYQGRYLWNPQWSQSAYGVPSQNAPSNGGTFNPQSGRYEQPITDYRPGFPPPLMGSYDQQSAGRPNPTEVYGKDAAAPPPPRQSFNGEPIVLVCPHGENGKVTYQLTCNNGSFDYTIGDGAKQEFKEDRAWNVVFQNGQGLRKSYTIRAGTYNFRQTPTGWDLFRQNPGTGPVSPIPLVGAEPFTVQIDAKGGVKIGDTHATIEELAETLAKIRDAQPQRAVVIKGDPAAPYQSVANVVEVCKKLKMARVDLSPVK